MSDIAPIGRPGPTPLPPADRATASTDPKPVNGHKVNGHGVDKVDLSPRAVLLSKLGELPAVRADLVQAVRDQIAAGTYETPEKLDAAAEALLEDL